MDDTLLQAPGRGAMAPRRRFQRVDTGENGGLEELLQLHATVVQQASFQAGANALADGLARKLGRERVSLGLMRLRASRP